VAGSGEARWGLLGVCGGVGLGGGPASGWNTRLAPGRRCRRLLLQGGAGVGRKGRDGVGWGGCRALQLVVVKGEEPGAWLAPGPAPGQQPCSCRGGLDAAAPAVPALPCPALPSPAAPPLPPLPQATGRAAPHTCCTTPPPPNAACCSAWAGSRARPTPWTSSCQCRWAGAVLRALCSPGSCMDRASAAPCPGPARPRSRHSCHSCLLPISSVQRPWPAAC
jgi:hypothetical protein